MYPGDRLMLGRIGKMLLVAFLTEAGGVLMQAGRGWLERRLLPQPKAQSPAAEDGAVVTTPAGTVVTDAEGYAIGFAADPQQASKKALDAPVQPT